MNKVFTIGLISLFFSGIYFQGICQNAETFTITQNGSSADLAPYLVAISSASLDHYRAGNQRTILNFEDGLQVELLSADELRQKGISVDLSVLRDPSLPLVIPTVFSIHSSGILLEKANAPLNAKYTLNK